MAAARTDLYRYHLPMKAPFVYAGGSFSDREGLLLAYCHDGGISFGEAAPLAEFSHETLQEVIDLAAGIHPLLQELASTPGMREQLRLIADAALPKSLEFAVSAIAIDVACRTSSRPVAAFLESSPADETRLNGVIGIHASADGAPWDLPSALNHMTTIVDLGRTSGITEFKLKAGPDVASIAKLLNQACLRHPGVGWKIDFNGSLTLDSYREFGALLDPATSAAIRYVEDPVACRIPDELTAVRQASRLPLAFEWTAHASDLPLEVVIRDRLADAVVIKPMALGAIHHWPELHALAVRHGVPLVLSSLLESGMARSQTAQIACLFGDPHHSHGLLTGRLFKADLIEDDWIDGGNIRIPDGIGWRYSSMGAFNPERHPLMEPVGPRPSSGHAHGVETHSPA